MSYSWWNNGSEGVYQGILALVVEILFSLREAGSDATYEDSFYDFRKHLNVVCSPGKGLSYSRNSVDEHARGIDFLIKFPSFPSMTYLNFWWNQYKFL